MTKKPHASFSPASEKSPRREVSPESFLDLKASWRIGRMEFCDPYGWHEIPNKKFHEIREKLREYEKQTWNEIMVQDRDKNHHVSTSDLSEKAWRRLKDLKLEDVEQLFSLRISGKERVWGVLTQGVLEVLWWDPKHEVCPSHKKHT
jgi:hypothetical protein